MTTVEIAGDWLTVRFTSAERAFGRLRDLDIPLPAVTHAEHLGSWQDACRGSGLLMGVTDIWIIGTRTHVGTRRLISLRGRRGRALRITLTGQPFDELILSVAHSHRVLHALADGRWTDHATDPSWAIGEIEALPPSPTRCPGSRTSSQRTTTRGGLTQ